MAKTILKPLILLVGATLLLASCSKRDTITKGTLVSRNDFESVLGWGGSNDASVTTDRAHSGQYAVRVGPQNEFGYTYVRTLGNMSASKIRTITVSAWVWVPEMRAPSQIVLDITRSPEVSTPVFSSTINLPVTVKRAKTWQQVSKTFTLPDSVRSTNQLKCYLWRCGTNENVYADDITLSVEN